jgi:hypothetical protein
MSLFGSSKEFIESPFEASELRRRFHLALPDGEYPITMVAKLQNIPPVTRLILREFLLPELRIALRRCARTAASVAMPETAMHKNNPSLVRVEDVGGAG